MKNANTQKPASQTATAKRPVNLQIKVAKPRPVVTAENSPQGPRDCFPLG